METSFALAGPTPTLYFHRQEVNPGTSVPDEGEEGPRPQTLLPSRTARQGTCSGGPPPPGRTGEGLPDHGENGGVAVGYRKTARRL